MTWIKDNIVSIFSLLLSIAVMLYTIYTNNETKLISEEALKTAKQLNKIEQGYFSEFPVITIDISSIDFKNNEILLYFRNNSEITISAFEIEIYPLSGLVYQSKPHYKEIDDLNKIKYKFNFSQLLVKNGYGHINIAPIIMKSIKDSKQKFININKLHKGLFHIVVYPIRLGQTQSEDTINYGGKNRTFVDLDFIPNRVIKLNINNIIKESKENIRIYGGYNN